MNNPLPTECKDLAFARNLIKQMKGEGGRHNSTTAPSRIAKSVAKDVVQAQQPHAPMDRAMRYRSLWELAPALMEQYQIPPEYFSGEVRHSTATEVQASQRAATEIYNQRLERWLLIASAQLNGIEWQPPIGRWGNHFIRSELEHCEIGDAVAFKDGQYQESAEEVRCFSVRFQSFGKARRFKKRGVSVTPDNGQSWHEEYFWERVE